MCCRLLDAGACLGICVFLFTNKSDNASHKGNSFGITRTTTTTTICGWIWRRANDDNDNDGNVVDDNDNVNSMCVAQSHSRPFMSLWMSVHFECFAFLSPRHCIRFGSEEMAREEKTPLTHTHAHAARLGEKNETQSAIPQCLQSYFAFALYSRSIYRSYDLRACIYIFFAFKREHSELFSISSSPRSSWHSPFCVFGRSFQPFLTLSLTLTESMNKFEAKPMPTSNSSRKMYKLSRSVKVQMSRNKKK